MLLCSQGNAVYSSSDNPIHSSAIDLYWDSWSWWITRPLRSMAAFLRKQARLKRPVAQTVEQERVIIAQILQSHSWKITAPLRWLKRKFLLYRQNSPS
jgi:hypothetical protein